MRLSAARLANHLAGEPRNVRAIVSRLRRQILAAVPSAAESVKFHCLCYYHLGARYGAIGGNICLIEVHDGEVRLSFIHGASLPDPHGLLRGRGKAKRFVPISNFDTGRDPRITSLVRAAAEWAPGSRAD